MFLKREKEFVLSALDDYLELEFKRVLNGKKDNNRCWILDEISFPSRKYPIYTGRVFLKDDSFITFSIDINNRDDLKQLIDQFLNQYRGCNFRHSIVKANSITFVSPGIIIELPMDLELDKEYHEIYSGKQFEEKKIYMSDLLNKVKLLTDNINIADMKIGEK